MSSSPLLTPLGHIDKELADRLQNDDKFRRRYIRFWAQTEVASEIRMLRKKRRLRQQQVAELADTGQSAISRIEKAEYDGWTFKTLITIAEALRARLRITFEPIEVVAESYRGQSTAGGRPRKAARSAG
jgi:DNA-binding XRE family transcriptional regulator